MKSTPTSLFGIFVLSKLLQVCFSIESNSNLKASSFLKKPKHCQAQVDAPVDPTPDPVDIPVEEFARISDCIMDAKSGECFTGLNNPRVTLYCEKWKLFYEANISKTDNNTFSFPKVRIPCEYTLNVQSHDTIELNLKKVITRPLVGEKVLPVIVSRRLEAGNFRVVLIKGEKTSTMDAVLRTPFSHTREDGTEINEEIYPNNRIGCDGDCHVNVDIEGKYGLETITFKHDFQPGERMQYFIYNGASKETLCNSGATVAIYQEDHLVCEVSVPECFGHDDDMKNWHVADFTIDGVETINMLTRDPPNDDLFRGPALLQIESSTKLGSAKLKKK